MHLELGFERTSVARITGAAILAVWTVAVFLPVAPAEEPPGKPPCVLRVGLSQDAPLMFRDSAGTPCGFSVDLLREIARRCDWRLEFVDGSWSECVRRLENGEVDVVGSMVETPARAERIRFCNPPIYVEWGELLLSRRCSGTNMRSLRRGRIGLLEGDAHAHAFLHLMAEFKIAIRPRWYSCYGDIVRAVEAGRLDGMVGVSIEGHECDISPQLKHSGLIFNPSSAKIAFRKDIDPRVVAEASEALRAMQHEDDGRPLEALIERYFRSSDDVRNRLPRWALMALVASTTGIGLLAVFTVLLKRLVAARTAALHRRESQLRQAAEIIGVEYWTYDTATGTFRVNDSLFDTLFEGTLDKTFSAEDLRRVVDPDDAPELEAAWYAYLSGEQDHFDVIYRLQIHGRTKYLRSRSSKELSGKRAHREIRGVSLDVTAFKESERVLRRSATRLTHTFDEFPVMIAFAMPDGKPFYCNALWSEKLGYPTREILAGLPGDITHPDDRHRGEEAREAVINGVRRATTFRSRYVCADGSTLRAEVTVGAIRDVCGELLHLVIHAVDITDQHRAERELCDARDKAEAANRAKSTFLATMSHEIRTPLNAVLGFGNLLAQESLPPKAAGFVRSVQTAGNALMRVLNDVLDFSRIEAGRLDIVSVPTDMSVLLGELDAIFRAAAKKKGLRLSVENRLHDTRLLMLDAKRLRQVLMNLVGNAVKFTESGRIDVTAESVPNPHRPCRHDVTIRVVDTGLGIPPDDRERIFGAFEQLQSTNCRRFDGTGLGLAISRRLVEAMGGRLELDSLAASGSTFTVRLPDVPISNRAAAGEVGANIVPQFVSSRVLVVDDVEDNAHVLAELLRGLGLVPKTVFSGEAALEQIERNRPDLIVTDLLMPGLSGEELARAVRKMPACAAIPILGITAALDWPEWCDASLFDAVLGKPVELECLVGAIERVVRRIDRAAPTRKERDKRLEPALAAAVKERFASRLRLIEHGAVDFDDVFVLADEMHAMAVRADSRPLLDLSFALVESAEQFNQRQIRRMLQKALAPAKKEHSHA